MDIFYKIRQCIDYQSLYALEDEFNKIGLTIQTTQKNRMILCKLVAGKPIANNVIEDFIFVGSYQQAETELSDRAVEKIIDFVGNNQGAPSKVENLARAWRNGLRMYGKTLFIANEDIEYVTDNLIIE